MRNNEDPAPFLTLKTQERDVSRSLANQKLLFGIASSVPSGTAKSNLMKRAGLKENQEVKMVLV